MLYMKSFTYLIALFLINIIHPNVVPDQSNSTTLVQQNNHFSLSHSNNPSSTQQISPPTLIQKNTTSPAPIKSDKWYNKQIIDNTLKPDMSTVIRYAHYASAALCDDNNLKRWDCKACQNVQGTELVKIFSHFFLGTKGYLALNHNDQAIILSFRGTENLMNWANNILVIQGKFGSINSKDARVHNGFLGAMESISGSFLNGLKTLLQNQQYSNYKIKVIGHSLGGAMASLAMLKIKDKLNLPWDKLELYTYGQPRTGNVQFAEWFDALPITVARSVNYNDPVPRLPPLSIFNYAHHTNELFINGPSTNYCDSSVLEDPACALSVSDKLLDSKSHVTYYNAHFEKANAC